MTRDRTPAGDSNYPKGGVPCSTDRFVAAESLVHHKKFSGKNPAQRAVAKRYR